MSFPEHSTLTREKQEGGNGAPHPPPHTYTPKGSVKSPWEGGHRSHYPTSIQLALTIPRFLQKRLEPERGKDSQGRNKFGCLLSFLFLLVCFCRRSLRMRACSAPQDRRPPSAGAHTPPASLGAGLRTQPCKLAQLPLPRPPDNLASTSRARSRLPPAPLPNPKPTAVLPRCLRRSQI